MNRCLAPLALAALLTSCSSLRLRSHVQGSESLEPTTERVLVNGDFTITSNLSKGQFAGDGRDEQTTWAFAFESDALDRVHAAGAPVQSATLTLSIEPNNESNGEILLMEGKKTLFTLKLSELYPDLPDGEVTIAEAQLPLEATNTEGESLGGLIEALVSAGKPLPMRFGDDASVFEAKLLLEYEE